MKNYSFISALLAVILALPGCGNDGKETDPYPYYDEIENEQVIMELEDVPAYVRDTYRDCVFICYSKYADEYYDAYLRDSLSIYDFPTEIQTDIQDHQIGIKLSEFANYEIPLYSKVYVSASVTNNKQVKMIPDGIDPMWGIIATANKAYLKYIKPRN